MQIDLIMHSLIVNAIILAHVHPVCLHAEVMDLLPFNMKDMWRSAVLGSSTSTRGMICHRHGDEEIEVLVYKAHLS
jgi:hypothetical protein